MFGFFLPGIGLGLQKGERWKSTRRLLTPAFTFPKLEPYLKIFQESVNILLVIKVLDDYFCDHEHSKTM